MVSDALDDDAVDTSDTSATDADLSELESSETPSAADQSESGRALRDLKAQLGREIAQERRAREQAEKVAIAAAAELQQLRGVVQNMGGYLAQRAEAERQARLAALPPEHRNAEEIKMLREQLARASKPATVAPKRYTPEEIEEYRDKRSSEIIAEMNRQYGLSGDAALTGDEDEIDWENEDTFLVTAKALGKLRQKLSGSGGNMAKQATKQDTDAEREERLVKKVLAQMGAGSSNSVKAASGKGGVSSDAFADTIRKYDSRGGIVKQQAALKEMVRRADEAAAPHLAKMK